MISINYPQASKSIAKFSRLISILSIKKYLREFGNKLKHSFLLLNLIMD